MDACSTSSRESEDCVPVTVMSHPVYTSDNDTKKPGILPTEARMNSIFQRMITQIDFLGRTIGMMNTRLDYLQSEIDELRGENNC